MIALKLLRNPFTLQLTKNQKELVSRVLFKAPISFKGGHLTQNLQPAFGRLDAFIRNKMRLESIPGITVAVTDKDRLLWRREYGLANIDSKKHVSEDTLFQIGSISKSFASIALLQLVEEGKVDLHRPVRKYLPWFEVKSKHKPITLDHILSHSAGIITGSERTPEGRTEIWGLRDTEATAKPGEWFHYSNIGYKIVGEIISELRGKSLPRVLQERVLRPLGMRNTSAEITNDIRQRSAVGYWPLYDDRPTKKNTQWAPCTWIESESADGSISSTAEEMCIYVRALLNRGRVPGCRLISDKSYSMLVQKRVDATEKDKKEYYGYGIGVEPYHGHLLMGHTGGMLGFISSMRFDLAENVGAFASTNCRRSVDDITRMAVELVRRSRHGEDLRGAEKVVIPPRPKLRDFTGTYTSTSHFLEIREKGGVLTARLGNEQVPLEWQEGDAFYSDHPSLEKSAFYFGRHKGKVVEVTHGEDWWTNSQFKGKRNISYPKEWDGLRGHYRSHDPWGTNIRVVVVKGSLQMLVPDYPPELLAPLGKNVFRIGKDPRSPERLSFSAFIDDKAHIATLSGCDYARTFTS